MEKPWPSRHGIALRIEELHLPESRLDLSNPNNINNHHYGHARRWFSRLAILQTFRDLDREQQQIPIDTHVLGHKLFSPPMMPTPEQALSNVMDAYEQDELLRYGSARNPKYEPITSHLIDQLVHEYNGLRA